VTSELVYDGTQLIFRIWCIWTLNCENGI